MFINRYYRAPACCT